jgi:hypothetical protein
MLLKRKRTPIITMMSGPVMDLGLTNAPRGPGVRAAAAECRENQRIWEMASPMGSEAEAAEVESAMERLPEAADSRRRGRAGAVHQQGGERLRRSEAQARSERNGTR